MGCAQAVDGPARHALVFEMVGPEDLANAVSLNSSLGTAARVLGPAIGGIVVAVAGAGVAFGINSLSFLAEVAALLALDTTKLHRAIRDHGATVVGGALDALKFVVRVPPRRRRVLRRARARRRSRSTSTCSCRSSPSRRSTGAPRRSG